VILGSVVLLNDMKFTDTVGSQGNQQALQDAERTEEMIRTDLQRMTRRVRAGTGVGNFEDALRENVSEYSQYYSNMTFEDGIVFVNAEFDAGESKEGRILNQTIEDEFELDGNKDWTVAKDSYFLSPFRMTVTEFPDTNPTFDPNTSVRVVGREGRTWELRINKSDIYGPDEPTLVAVVDGEQVGKIRTGPGVRIDFESGSINGTAKPGFDYAEYLKAPYTVEMDNELNGPTGSPSPHLAKGRYKIGTDSRVHGIDTSASNPEIRALPAARPAVTITYQRPELQYTTTIYLDEGGS
jgi:hypothetical protein